MRRATEDRPGGPVFCSATFVRRLGEAGYGPEDGRVGTLDLLARSGLPVPEGFVLTAEGHREFLRVSGLGGEQVRSSTPGRGAAGRMRRGLGEALEREIRAALLDLGARAVIVVWRHGIRRGLGTIPAVVAAVREAWVPAPAGGETPVWPVLVQRQASPEYAGWTTTADLRPGCAGPGGVPLHDLEPAPGRDRDGISRLTRTAAGALGSAVRLGWGLEEGRWLLVSVEEDPGQQT